MALASRRSAQWGYDLREVLFRIFTSMWAKIIHDRIKPRLHVCDARLVQLKGGRFPGAVGMDSDCHIHSRGSINIQFLR